MREIKFRGKRIDNGEWVYWNQFGEYTKPFMSGHDLHSHVSEMDVIHETVGQLFQDDFYKGDVIQTEHEKIVKGEYDSNKYNKVGVLEYYKGYKFGWRIRWKRGHMMIENTMQLGRMKAKRLGNIFDNPELLELEGKK